MGEGNYFSVPDSISCENTSHESILPQLQFSELGSVL